MQYLVSVIDDKTGSATPDDMVAIDAFNDSRPPPYRGAGPSPGDAVDYRELGVRLAAPVEDR